MFIRITMLLAAAVLASCPVTLPAQTTLYSAYPKYRAEGFDSRRFNSGAVYAELARYADNDLVDMEETGKSMGGKPIYLLRMGSGKQNVFLWSQMHGNESTATMALMDILRFFTADDQLNDLRRRILSNTTIYMIPLLNPDGGDRFVRRNNLGIDLNRDAVRLTTPEARVLMETRDRIDADFGFNLHDQNRWSGVGHTGRPASISFLAPAFNDDKDLNERRLDAMRVISVMINAINPHLPGQIGKYSDEFEPRAFGDNFQKLGTRTILIESGYTYNDDEKQELRRVHFVVVLEALKSIAAQSFKTHPTDLYDKLPFNRGNMADLVIRNLDYELDGHTYLVDIAFRRQEVKDPDGKVCYYRKISDIGDLSTTFGYVDFDAKGYRIEWGRVKPEVYSSIDGITGQTTADAVRIGMHTFLTTDRESLAGFDPDVPYRLRTPDRELKNELNYQADPAFYLARDDQLAYLVVNGKLWQLGKGGIRAAREGGDGFETKR